MILSVNLPIQVQKTKIQTTLQVLTNERDDLMKQVRF